jgi:DNA-binding transcriptional ArsR family regulator
MAQIHEHPLMHLSIVVARFFVEGAGVPKQTAADTAAKAGKPHDPASSMTLEKAGNGDVCAEHHHHPAALALKPLALHEAQEMAQFFTALADPTRLRLISLLAAEDCCVCDLAQQLGMTDSAISHQLRTLRAARLVRYRKEGRQVFYRLHDHHVVALYRTVQEHLAE